VRHTHPTTFHALGFSLAASATVAEAFERVARYFRLVTEAATTTVSRPLNSLRFEVQLDPATETSPEVVDAILGICVRMSRALAGRTLNPRLVEMRRAAPQDPAPYQRYFRSAIVFGAPIDALTFDADACDRPLPAANPELARVNEAIAAQHLAALEATNIVLRVRTHLVEALPRGEPAQAHVARSLGLSLRNLQRLLADAGTTYTATLDAVRKELALSYIDDTRYSLGEITYLLGFAEPSTFSRSFKRWTGVSPRDHRTRKPRDGALQLRARRKSTNIRP
jgi:AraC-like DNA-binding protein